MNKNLEEALAAREKLLKEKPHLQAYQDELDTLLDKVPAGQRFEVLGQLMAEKLLNLQEQFGKLKEMLPDADTR